MTNIHSNHSGTPRPKVGRMTGSESPPVLPDRVDGSERPEPEASHMTALLIREKQLPALLGLSRATIRRAMEAGRFPRCVRIGRCVAWRRVDLEAWIDQGCRIVK